MKLTTINLLHYFSLYVIFEEEFIIFIFDSFQMGGGEQTGFGAHASSFSKYNGGSLSELTSAGSWGWLLT